MYKKVLYTCVIFTKGSIFLILFTERRNDKFLILPFDIHILTLLLKVFLMKVPESQ